MTAAGSSPAGRLGGRPASAPRAIAAVGRQALVALTWWCCATGAATAQPVDYTVVPPAAAPGPYPVACDDVDQDFARLRPGEDAASYWDGKPRGDGSPRYVTDLFVQPWSGQVQTLPIPDDRELFGRYRGGSFASAALVCYPTTAANPRADFLLPDGRRVPRMQRGGEAPILPDGGGRWPVLLFSHGLGGSPLGSGYLDFVDAVRELTATSSRRRSTATARFAEVSLDNVGEILAAILGFDRFVAMQALRPTGLVATLTGCSPIRSGATSSTPVGSAASGRAWAARRCCCWAAPASRRRSVRHGSACSSSRA